MENKVKKIDFKNIWYRFASTFKKPYVYICLGLILIDLLTKWLIVWNKSAFAGDNKIYIIPGFLFVTLTFNKGAIFGIGGEDWTRILLIVIRFLLAIIIPLIYFWKARNVKKRYKACILMIYAGCIGNLIDGLFYWGPLVGFDGVVDWIGFSFFGFIFNLADSYVTVAVFLVIIFIIVDEIIEAKKRNRRGEFSMTPEEYEKHLAELNKLKNTNQCNTNNDENKIINDVNKDKKD